MEKMENIKELLVGVKILVKIAKKVTADGKFDLADLVHLQELFFEFPKLKEAASDLQKLPEEIKGLSAAEVVELVSFIDKLVKEIEAV